MAKSWRKHGSVWRSPALTILLIILLPVLIGAVYVQTYLYPKAQTAPVDWGQAIHLSNTSANNQTYLTLPRTGTDLINLNQEFTIEFWFKLDDLSPSRQHLLETTDKHLMIYTELEANGFTNMRIYISNGTAFDLFYGTGGVIQAGKWNHFALSYIPSLTGGSFMNYLNGRSTYISYVPFGKTLPFTDMGTDILVSRMTDAYPGIINGAIDELRFSNSARYPYQTGPGTYTVPVLPFMSDDHTIALFHFNNTYTNDAPSGNAIQLVPTGPIDFVPSVLLPTPTPTATPTPTNTPTPTPQALSVQILSPNGGETLTIGTVYRITWNSSTNIDKVMLGYKWCDSCLDWITSAPIPNTGYYDWTVKIGNLATTQFKIDLIGYESGVGNTEDISDGYFTILQPSPTPTPTNTPTPTPSPTPSPTPKPTPTPTRRPTLTPTPLPGPIFITQALRSGMIGFPYAAQIRGYSQRGRKLAMTITGLPPGIGTEKCLTTPGFYPTISCPIRGIPTRAGKFAVIATLTDSAGLRTTKQFTLVIAGRPWWWTIFGAQTFTPQPGIND